MKEELKEGDLVVYNGFFGKEAVFINAVFDEVVLIDDILWVDKKLAVKWGKLVKKSKILK